MRKTSEEVRGIATAHWEYTRDIIAMAVAASGGEFFSKDMALMLEMQYVEAMIHGYKHGIADMEAERRDEIES